MTQLTDQHVEEMLTRTGEALSPRREALKALLVGVPVHEQERPTLLIISTYMNMYTKVGVALAAILVVVGGAYYVSAPSSTNIAMEQSDVLQPQQDSSTATMMAKTVVAPEPQAATDSFDDFAAAMQADAAAQEAALQSVDQSTDEGVMSANTVTSSSQPYDPASI